MQTDRIRALAADRGISLSFICKKIGVAPPYFLDIEKSGRKIPADKINKIANLLYTTPEYLNGETDEKEKPATGLPSDGLSEKKVQLINQIRDADDDTVDLLFQIADRIMHDRPEE